MIIYQNKLSDENSYYHFLFKPFSTNVRLMDKAGSSLLLAKYLKKTCGRVIFWVKMLGVSVSGIVVGNGLIQVCYAIIK